MSQTLDNIKTIAERNNMQLTVRIENPNNLYYEPDSPWYAYANRNKECTIELCGTTASANNFDNDLMLASNGYDAKQRQINSLSEELETTHNKLDELLDAIDIIKEKLQHEADTDIFYSFSYEKCLKIINENLP